MNIITNKEAFSDESQAQNPKKVGGKRGRPRKVDLVAVADQVNAAATPTPAPQEAPAPVAADSSEKTVFYQAATPTHQRIRPPFRPSSETQGSRINRPAPQAQAPVATTEGAREVIAPRTPAGSNPHMLTMRGTRMQEPQPHRTGFTVARRRSDRGQMPADGSGDFSLDVAPPAVKTAATHHYGFEEKWLRNGVEGENVKIIPLGGLEEIGKNMTLFEYKDDIVIVDMGFMFPESDMFGVDYVIPDITYLQDKKDKIRGAVITHGHLDHIGAIPYLVEKLGFPTMYGTAVTLGMIKQRLEEFGLTGKNKLVTIESDNDVIQLGAFRIYPFRLLHSVPGAIGLEIETPNGRIAYCTDWKFDYTPSDNKPVDLRVLASIGARGVDMLFSDSTNAERPGHSVSEKVVEQSLEKAITAAPGRVICAMFSSNLNRIQQAINVAGRNGRKVLIVGRSMQQNVEMALGIRAIVVPPNTLISEREASHIDDSKLLVLSTGAQGEDRSALQRMANGEHKVIKIRKGDTVIISASPIPGNERSVSGLMDILYKAGAQVIYNKTLDIHTTGHGTQEDLKLMIALMQPKFFVPLHGERSKLIMHGELAKEVGVAPESIIIGDNGLILEMDYTGKVYPTDNHVPAGYVMVDGLGVGDVGNVVLRDRQVMAQEGIFCIFCLYDHKTGKFIQSPDLISRGFIYMRENERFIADVRTEIKRYLDNAAGKNVDLSEVKNGLRDHISKILFDKTERSPMVIPVIAEV